MGAIFRDHRRTLLLAAVVIFVPIGFLEALDDELQKPLEDPEVGDPVDLVAIGGAALVHAAGALLGEVIYTGVVAAVVTNVRHRRERPLAEALRRLPVWRLVAVDLLYAAVVVGGLLLLIVPGVVFLVWFALVAPAVEIEHLGVRAAFRRSREVVRGHFWLVFGLVIPILVVEDVLVSLASSGSIWAFGETFAGHWVSATLVNVIAAPLFALAVVVLFFELRQSSKARTASP